MAITSDQITGGITDTNNQQFTTGVLPKIPELDEDTSPKLNVTMQLFGLPFQFLPSVDQRNPDVSKVIGRKFAENIIMDSNVVTIIPGEPRYLPGSHNKTGWSNALIEAGNDNFAPFQHLSKYQDKQLRLYDFQSAYIKYYQYVNMLCRITAGFLELGDETGYVINKAPVNFLNYDWKNYRWNGKNYHSTIGGIADEASNKIVTALKTTGEKMVKTITGGKIDMSDPTSNKSNAELDVAENLLKNTNYLQFYCDADNPNGNESLSNNTQPSMFKQLLEQGSNAMRDIAFMANTGGVDTGKLGQLGESALGALKETFGGESDSDMTSFAGGLLNRILSTGKSVIKGENIMMPDIWAGSTNSKAYDLTFHFRSPLGNRVSNYVECIVPMLHCVGLAYPRGTTANSYASPPLVKVYKRGSWTANLAMVTGIEIERGEEADSFNIDSVPMELTVRLSITDLYTDVALTPPNDVKLFSTNSSLIEFLATTCGLDLVEPQLNTKIQVLWNMEKTKFTDIPSTALGKITETFDRAFAIFTSL